VHGQRRTVLGLERGIDFTAHHEVKVVVELEFAVPERLFRDKQASSFGAQLQALAPRA
jgi:hypothetical protein